LVGFATTNFTPGAGADIVMESITLKMPEPGGFERYRRFDQPFWRQQALVGVYNKMKRSNLVHKLLFVASSLLCLAIGVASPEEQIPKDLRLELRTVTGSRRFRLGEAIPLELVFSSSASKKYLEPCLFLDWNCFGFPICRFTNHWTLSITPKEGWDDLHHGCHTVGGPRLPVEGDDLSAKPLVIRFDLTKRFQFKTPGVYTVRFSTDVGLDDDSNPIVDFSNPPSKRSQPNSVNVSSELQLEIVLVSARQYGPS
jgi:hypothetical protein